MENEKVKQLAETLKKQGLAASEYEAIEKAKSILNVKTQNNNASQEEDKPPGQEMKQAMPNLDPSIINQNVPLNELMKEVNVTPEQVEAQKKEKLDDIETEVNIIKKDIKQSKKTEQIKEEITKVKEKINKIEEVKTEDKPQKNKEQPEEDIFKEEKKIDLTKIFGNKK